MRTYIYMYMNQQMHEWVRGSGTPRGRRGASVHDINVGLPSVPRFAEVGRQLCDLRLREERLRITPGPWVSDVKIKSQIEHEADSLSAVSTPISTIQRLVGIFETVFVFRIRVLSALKRKL